LEWNWARSELLIFFFPAFFVFMTITYYFEPYMVPVGLLLIFLKHYLVTSYIGNTTTPPITASLI
jgi:hypothetical protein